MFLNENKIILNMFPIFMFRRSFFLLFHVKSIFFMYVWVCISVSSECWCSIFNSISFDICRPSASPNSDSIIIRNRKIHLFTGFVFIFFDSRVAWRIQFYFMDHIRRRWRAQDTVYRTPIWWRWFVFTLRHSLYFLWGKRLTIHEFST